MDSTRQRGLEDLRWPSLTRTEKLTVAAVLARYGGGPSHAHLDNVAFELRECEGRHVPLVLTPLQNRTIAQALECFAAELEAAGDGFREAPTVARTAHYSAGYLRSLLDRLVKGALAQDGEGLDRIVEMLALDAPRDASPGLLVERGIARLRTLGAAEVLQPLLGRCSQAAAQRCRERSSAAGARPVDADFELEIADGNGERSALARRSFAAALSSLKEDDRAGWASFLVRLRSGLVEGCRNAPAYPDTAQVAAQVAHLIATSVRAHLRELAGLPWEAVSPGLKAILNRYPALKQESSLREFVKAEVRRAAPARAPGAEASLGRKGSIKRAERAAEVEAPQDAPVPSPSRG